MNVVKVMAPGGDEKEAKKQVEQVQGDCQQQGVEPKTLRCLSRATSQQDVSQCMTERAKAAPSRKVALDTKTGVVTCDAYVAAMVSCTEKMKPEESKAMREAMPVMLAAWVDAAATPEGRQALGTGCRQALDAAKARYGQLGCSFGDDAKPATAPASPPAPAQPKRK
jgi:hypothetical protein